MYFNELLYIQSLMVGEHIARQNASSQRHDSCCSMKQVNGFYIAYIGIFLRSEIVSQIRGGSRTFRGGGGTTSAKGASFVGVTEAISSRYC